LTIVPRYTAFPFFTESLMKRLLLACLGLSASLSAAAAPVQVHSIAQEFANFWDATQTMPEAERVAAFKRRVAPKFPEFYGIERYQGKRTQARQDEIIARALAAFGAQRQAYLDKVAGFDADLPRHVASFTRSFPAFQPQVPIWFLHSMGEMDGGTRDFNGKHYLIFGADMMVRVHGSGDEAAFFHHELFHIHHDAVAPECDHQGMWQPLWREGLATYVSQVLNPDASEKQMLLTFPEGSLEVTKARLHESLADVEKVLDNPDERYYGPLFQTGKDDTGLAPRRGYYMGYLVAKEIGKGRDLATLATLNCADARKLVIDAVRLLKQRSAPAPAPAP
jgi:hypothetical protein